jgi:hypothetical protein
LTKFKALRGVHRVAAQHYRVTGTYAQTGSFLAWEYALTASEAKDSNLKSFTINFWVDSSGRPTRITVASQSPTLKLSITETFGHYNKPVVIRVP